jgi:hypothetical protein
MSNELETTVWCQKCEVVKFEVWRVPTDQSDIFTHQILTPEGELFKGSIKVCNCGTNLERKNVE